ncbi:hypothetical protein V7S43_016498 [Phytophthora oleae]|uniref:Uncharacterized protein n=1 Tax=Phytophthora oleae TaxID=2107226 RepID=A0ABD3EZK6_9STRA
MPSLGTFVFALGLTLLAVSTTGTQAATTSKWVVIDPTIAEESLLITALEDESIYNPDITDFICAKSVEALYAKPQAHDVTKYTFVVNGCIVRSEYAGRYFDLFFYPECGNFDVLISSGPKKELEVKSIKIHKVKSQATKN